MTAMEMLATQLKSMNVKCNIKIDKMNQQNDKNA